MSEPVVSRPGVGLQPIRFEVSHEDVLGTVVFHVLLSTASEYMSAFTVSGGPAFQTHAFLEDIQVKAEPQNQPKVIVGKGSVMISRIRREKGRAAFGGEVREKSSFGRVQGRHDLVKLLAVTSLGHLFLKLRDRILGSGLDI
jgi:hypothetical protein